MIDTISTDRVYKLLLIRSELAYLIPDGISNDDIKFIESDEKINWNYTRVPIYSIQEITHDSANILYRQFNMVDGIVSFIADKQVKQLNVTQDFLSELQQTLHPLS